jgi:UDP-3-O-[3-hydroxymyristoyl] glucosamine N-acyltransferase
VTIGDNTTLGSSVTIGDNATIAENVRIAENTKIGENITMTTGGEIDGNALIFYNQSTKCNCCSC